MEIIYTGLVLGFFTSLHCAGMCGPIALAIPLKGTSTGIKVLTGIIYNLGRTVTYVLAGILFGFAGKSFSMLGFQQWISVISGSIIIITAIIPFLIGKSIEQTMSGTGFTRIVQRGFSKLFAIESVAGFFFVGMLNGLLPCGPLYSALIASLGTASVLYAALFMLLFGLGTLPLMLAFMLAGNIISSEIRKFIRNVLPIILIFIGILFILRGIGLGIPYISPDKHKIESHIKTDTKNDTSKSVIHDCCMKK
jgi:uncharacterized protein